MRVQVPPQAPLQRDTIVMIRETDFPIGTTVHLRCNHVLMMVQDTKIVEECEFINDEPTTITKLMVSVIWHNDVGLLCQATVNAKVLEIEEKYND